MDAELVDRGSTWACQAWLFTLEKKKNQPWQWLSILDVKHVPPPDRAPYLNVIIIWHRSSVFSPSWYQTTRVTNHEHQRDNVPLYLLSLVSRVTNLEASHCFAATQVDRSWEAMCYFVGVANHKSLSGLSSLWLITTVLKKNIVLAITVASFHNFGYMFVLGSTRT